MKLTEQQLKKIIQEELSLLDEAGLIDRFRKGFQQGKDWWNKKPAAGGSSSAAAPAAGSPAPAAGAAPAGKAPAGAAAGAAPAGKAPAGAAAGSPADKKSQLEKAYGNQQFLNLIRQKMETHKDSIEAAKTKEDLRKILYKVSSEIKDKNMGLVYDNYVKVINQAFKVGGLDSNSQLSLTSAGGFRKKVLELAQQSGGTMSPEKDPQLTKRLELFKQNMPQLFGTIQNNLSSTIQKIVASSLALREEAAPTSGTDVASKASGPISKIISKYINDDLNAVLKSITPAEFKQAYDIVSQKSLKGYIPQDTKSAKKDGESEDTKSAKKDGDFKKVNPAQAAKSFKKSSKSFRSIEEQEEIKSSPLASTEIELLDVVMQIKGKQNKNQSLVAIIKGAVEKATQDNRIKKFFTPEIANKVISAITSSARSLKQLISADPSVTSQAVKKSQFPDATRQEPAQAKPAEVKPTQKANTEINETKTSLNENRLNRMKLLAGIIKK